MKWWDFKISHRVAHPSLTQENLSKNHLCTGNNLAMFSWVVVCFLWSDLSLMSEMQPWKSLSICRTHWMQRPDKWSDSSMMVLKCITKTNSEPLKVMQRCFSVCVCMCVGWLFMSTFMVVWICFYYLISIRFLLHHRVFISPGLFARHARQHDRNGLPVLFSALQSKHIAAFFKSSTLSLTFLVGGEDKWKAYYLAEFISSFGLYSWIFFSLL